MAKLEKKKERKRFKKKILAKQQITKTMDSVNCKEKRGRKSWAKKKEAIKRLLFFWLTVIWRYLYASLDAHPGPFYIRFISLLLWAFSSSCLWKVKAREKTGGKPQQFEERKNITEKPQKSTFKYLYNNIKAKEERGRRLKMLPVKPDKNSQKKVKALDVEFWGEL